MDVNFGGYLGAEFRNITFPGERVAAGQALAAYQVYERDDRHIRALNQAGDLRQAIAFDTSYASGNSNWAFTRYDRALVDAGRHQPARVHRGDRRGPARRHGLERAHPGRRPSYSSQA